ncbi:MAG: UDP-N-acetylmuramoyl-L-alanine--D-glutamate ligase [Thermovirgaceae bacterium]
MSFDRKVLAGKNITIVGAGVSGKALVALAADLGAKVFVTDMGPVSSKTRRFLEHRGVAFEEKGHTRKALECDALILSSGIPPSAKPVVEAEKRSIPVIGELDFVADHLKGRIIGVTGSNGKTTTTALTGHILADGGFKTAVAGNIGNPLAECAFGEYDWIVAELSSFQLYWARDFEIDLAVLTNIAPDHLDWHGSFDDYIATKMKVFTFARRGSPGICQAVDVAGVLRASYSRALKILSLRKDDGSSTHGGRDGISLSEEKCLLFRNGRPIFLFSCKDVPLVGTHNIENAAMASAAAALAGAGSTGIAKSIAAFKPLPHRCEKVATINGITYVDDSKGTNVAAASAALDSIKGPIVVILGGKGKGEDYGPLADAVVRNAQGAVLIGEEKDRIASSLLAQGYKSFSRATTMEDAVKAARNMASPNGTVLLSPACTSWDMYENYKARGEHFRQIVGSLGGRSS